MYYPCSENKGADQLRSYCEGDLRICFRIGKNHVFSRCGSNYNKTNDGNDDKSKIFLESNLALSELGICGDQHLTFECLTSFWYLLRTSDDREPPYEQQ